MIRQTINDGTAPMLGPIQTRGPRIPAAAFLLVGATLWSAAPAFAQSTGPSPDVAQAVEAARRDNPGLRVTYDSRTGLPSRISNIAEPPRGLARSLGASESRPPNDAAIERAVQAFFSRHALRSAFPSGNVAERRVVRTVKPDPDLPGQYVATVEQSVAGIPVFGSSGKVTVSRSLAVRSLTASFSRLDGVDITTDIERDRAIDLARSELKRRIATREKQPFGLGPQVDPSAIDNAEPTATKTIFDPKLIKRGREASGDARLAWHVVIDSYQLFVDAKTGDVLYTYRDHRSFSVRQIVDLAEATTAPDVFAINEETSSRDSDVSDDAIRAYQNSGAVRDFFFTMFGRKSFDDGRMRPDNYGSAIVSYVRYGKRALAHWCPAKSSYCPSANAAVYGPGYAGELDVIGHEFMHGVIAHEVDLKYADESGAVNESLADIFGSLIELRTRGRGGNWLLGEGLPNYSMTAPMRSLANPGLADADGNSLFKPDDGFNVGTNRGQPSHYQDYVYPKSRICSTTGDYDNGCVHFNSGILNKFAHLIAMGGEHHGVKVTGIGTVKLGELAYRTLRVGLNKTSGLRDAANGFVDACYAFEAANVRGFTSENCRTVENAQRAVGLDQPLG